MKTGKSFCAQFLTDDVVLSGEHSEYNFFDISEIEKLDNLSEKYKEVIFSCVKPGTEIGKDTSTLTITLNF
mgnify:FL=1